ALASTRSASRSPRLKSSASDGTAQENIYACPECLAFARSKDDAECVIGLQSVRVYRMRHRLYPSAADGAAPRAPRGHGCPGATAVGHARLWASGPALSAAGHRHGAAWWAWRSRVGTGEPAICRGGGQGNRSGTGEWSTRYRP